VVDDVDELVHAALEAGEARFDVGRRDRRLRSRLRRRHRDPVELGFALASREHGHHAQQFHGDRLTTRARRELA
jgi:hypothetical protein